MTRLISRALLASLLLGLPCESHAQDRLAAARTLYLNAAYDEALALLSDAAARAAADSVAELEHYRALCLIALGRTAEAEQAITRGVEADPLAIPDTSELAPRVASVFSTTRARLLPDIARRALGEGRQLLQSGDATAASRRFELVTRLLADPALAGRNDLSDLSLAASAFTELTRAQLASAAKPAPASPPAARDTRPNAAANAAQAATDTPAAATSREPVATRQSVAISQALPRWQPENQTIARMSFSGAVKVSIDATGRVTAAEMVRPVYPPYDRLVLAAARTWTYTPAMRGDQPVPSDRIVEIQLLPRGTRQP